MKKTISRIISFTIAVVILCAMTTVAFAVSDTWTGAFVVKDPNYIYVASYKQTLNVTATEASATLTISDIGPLSTIVFAVVDGGAYGTRAGRTVKIGDIYGEGETYAKGSCDYNEYNYTNVYADCGYSYYGINLPSRTLYAD